MNELIVRITENSQDVEVLYHDVFKNKTLEKQIYLPEFISFLNNLETDKEDNILIPTYLDPNIIGYSQLGSDSVYIINQPEHERYVTCSFHNDSNNVFKIKFPSSIYEVRTRNSEIHTIRAFCYKEWNNMKTELYKYAMPNMLTQDKICIGSSIKKKNVSIIEALELIIYSPYSHTKVDNIKSFSSTMNYFKFLENNDFPYHLLKRKKDFFLKDLF